MNDVVRPPHHLFHRFHDGRFGSVVDLRLRFVEIKIVAIAQ